ncbi:hypothetical protein PHYSODRAFT_307722 [Phytophthora sojae]|uniref:Uncharacterized protein n=1 Tax=Phytophthora sojae (strain P6497) TaxID=1094619 RepID=G5AFS1_PHYSP|nr:hypothetical protein PHYSODRAFT_307722 [Phytophthora sojae]EGZ05437.1 hypothetical protein PHYSODRAFT_307722 [Phytophthora sojae]|eukprot:XP_009538968.1 hypothetical protein PHYSODRAFT_307722 [Phytophthora sojae]
MAFALLQPACLAAPFGLLTHPLPPSPPSSRTNCPPPHPSAARFSYLQLDGQPAGCPFGLDLHQYWSVRSWEGMLSELLTSASRWWFLQRLSARPYLAIAARRAAPFCLLRVGTCVA